MADRHVGGSGGALPVGALGRESARALRLVAAGQWRPSPADAEAAVAVLGRLTAALPVRRGAAARTRATDRDRRLQLVLRTVVHHLDAGAVSPSAAALLAAVARALLPWHGVPNPPAAAAAPAYGARPGASDGVARTPTEAGEALLPGLIVVFSALAAPSPPGAGPLTPPAEPWQVRYEGRFRRHGHPAPGVWTASTVHCPGCGGTTGPWTVTCDWSRIALGCPCGSVTRAHGLAFSEVRLVLPEV
ncbi:hypothetical protein SHL15_7331 [Streptomyces hygroscopicus subsp. limoneus]|nr:hypothetical protein SHL15_7331 [Streptomyces hygroscopicus subsp. limoneus]